MKYVYKYTNSLFGTMIEILILLKGKLQPRLSVIRAGVSGSIPLTEMFMLWLYYLNYTDGVIYMKLLSGRGKNLTMLLVLLIN